MSRREPDLAVETLRWCAILAVPILAIQYWWITLAVALAVLVAVLIRRARKRLVALDRDRL